MCAAGFNIIQVTGILIHPRCVQFASEIGGYAWEKDPVDGRATNRPRDADNHLMDAMRYAMEPFIRRRIAAPPERQRPQTDGVSAQDMRGGWDGLNAGFRLHRKKGTG